MQPAYKLKKYCYWEESRWGSKQWHNRAKSLPPNGRITMNNIDSNVDNDKMIELVDLILINLWKSGKSMIFRDMSVTTKRNIEFQGVIL